jgi:hypothetical protein
MEFKNKYLKYKRKYYQFKNEEKTENILLMFLGGLPNEDNTEIYNHWKSLIECSDINNFKIVVHPLTIDNFIIPPIWNLFDIQVVDINHHIGTAWATRSLIDATLLMMQYGRSKFNNIKKYVLLSNSCVPLFNFSNLYIALTENSKSWLMSYSENENQRNHLVYIQEVNGGLFNLYERNYFSQWMALDKIHADYFFIDNQTYLIETDNQTKTVYCNNTNKVIINPNINQTPKSIELTKLLNSFDSLITFNHLNLDKLPCGAMDEHFFGMFIYYKLLHDEPIDNYISILLDNIVTQSDQQIHDKLIYLKKFDNELNINFEQINRNKVQVNLKNMKTYNNNLIDIYPYDEQHVYTPGPFNLNQIKKQYYIKSYKSQTDNNNYIINQTRNPELKTPINSMNGLYSKNVVSKFYPVSSTFTDWDKWSPDPFNVLRDCIFPNTTFNFRDYLNIDTPINALNYLINLNSLNPDSYFDFNEIKIKMPMYHPLEYTEWTLQNIINGYILLSYFSDIFIRPEKSWPHYEFKWVYDSWKNYICEYFNNYEELNYIITKDGVQYEIQFIDCIKNIIDNLITNYDTDKKYGSYIIPDVITSAISNGALFIRKCTNNCGISAYTNIICSLNFNEINILNKKLDNCRYWKWNSGIINRNSSNYILDTVIKHGKNKNYDQLIKLLIGCNDDIELYKKVIKIAIYTGNSIKNLNSDKNYTIIRKEVINYNFEYNIDNIKKQIFECNIIFKNLINWLKNNYSNEFIIKYNKYFFRKLEFKNYMNQ